MQNFELNKIAASILLAGLIAMLAGFITDVLYKPHVTTTRGYKVEVVKNDVANNKKADEVIDITALMNDAQIDKGMVVAKKCTACHSFEKGKPHKVGPNLWNILGQKVASKEGYVYSNAMKDIDVTWSYEELFAFLQNPKKYVPGTKMSFIGIKKPKDIANLMEFLRNKGDSSYPLP